MGDGTALNSENSSWFCFQFYILCPSFLFDYSAVYIQFLIDISTFWFLITLCNIPEGLVTKLHGKQLHILLYSAWVIICAMLIYTNPRVPFGINMLVAKVRFLLFYTQLLKICSISPVIVKSEFAIAFLIMTKKRLCFK